MEIVVRQILAFTEKEIALGMRFLWEYLSEAVLNPLTHAIWFGVLYYGMFSLGISSIGSVTRRDFVQFLLLGSLVSGFLISGMHIFARRFNEEKYWQTIDGLLMAPMRRLVLLFGIGCAELVRLIFLMVPFLALCFLAAPIPIERLVAAVATLLLLHVGILGLGLIKGGLALTNENLAALWEWVYLGIAFLACFYYPKAFLPSWLHPLVELNPVYHGVAALRMLWFQPGSATVWSHLWWVVGFACLMPCLGTIVFNGVLQRLERQGY